MEETKNNKVLHGTELMDSLSKKLLEDVPGMSREALEKEVVNLLQSYAILWKEKLNFEEAILRFKEAIDIKDAVIKKLEDRSRRSVSKQLPFFSDRMKYYQVRHDNLYQVLVQDNTDTQLPSPPLNIREEGGGKLTPVSADQHWSLDRCVGIINLSEKDNIFTSDEDDYVLVEPHFTRLAKEGFPDGKIVYGNRNSVRVEILTPPARPYEKLNQMVGCADIKKRLTEFRCLAEYNKARLRQSHDFPVMDIFLHSVFYGNPGTGKTTVCRLYGALLKEAGLLTKGHVVVADRNIFCGECFGNTEEMMPQLIQMSRGGILMFDEAYLLEGTHPNDPNKMILPLLLSALADNNKDWAVVLCGYKDKLDKMLAQNPGLYSRFINKFEFKDYNLDELTEIGVRYLNSFGHSFTTDGLAGFREQLSAAMAGSNTETWANARSVKSMIEHIYIQRAMRYSKEGTLDREITAADICAIPCDHRRRIGF